MGKKVFLASEIPRENVQLQEKLAWLEKRKVGRPVKAH